MSKPTHEELVKLFDKSNQQNQKELILEELVEIIDSIPFEEFQSALYLLQCETSEYSPKYQMKMEKIFDLLSKIKEYKNV